MGEYIQANIKATETDCDFYGSPGRRLDHDCFAKVALSKMVLSRGSSNKGATMFGSELEQQVQITMEISRASISRRLSHEHINTDDTIAVLAFTPGQWAQMVSSIGDGSGTPVTLLQAPKRGTPADFMPGLVQDSLVAKHAEGMLEMGRRTGEQVAKVQKALDRFLEPGAKAPSKKEIHELRMQLIHAGEHMASNMKFAQDRFTENMDSAVTDAKITIETFMGVTMMHRGMENLQAMAKMPNLVQGNDETRQPLVENGVALEVDSE